jgi:nucleotide-binding universal stress UspA family protein
MRLKLLHSFDIQKILVPVDGSENSKKAAYYSLVIADKFKAWVNILYVDPTNKSENSGGAYSAIEGSQQTQSFFDEIRNRAHQIDVNLKTDNIITQNSVVTEIVEYAKKENVDLILIGIRSASDFKFMLGSTASGVASNAHCPVLIVK